jgi:heme A synthase
MEIDQRTSPHEKTPSKAWYLLPIFFGLVGGLIMFFVLKDEDRRMAKKGAVVGAILTAVYVGVGIVTPIAGVLLLGA